MQGVHTVAAKAKRARGAARGSAAGERSLARLIICSPDFRLVFAHLSFTRMIIGHLILARPTFARLTFVRLILARLILGGRLKNDWAKI